MWESPASLWSRLKLGREGFLQRLMTTLIMGGDAPRWNTQTRPCDQGMHFLRLLDGLAHGHEPLDDSSPPPDHFVDEYLLPKVEESAENGWPDWATLWADRVWIIELKTEPGSHRPTQLPYYLRLAAAAHPDQSVDLTYITGPLTKPAPDVADGQRYSHVRWTEVLPLVMTVWGEDSRSEVRAYVDAVQGGRRQPLIATPNGAAKRLSSHGRCRRRHFYARAGRRSDCHRRSAPRTGARHCSRRTTAGLRRW